MTAKAPAPPMSYYGGKQRLARRIAALLPPHEHYIEPYAGSLAVLLAKAPSRIETVNDLDHKLMTFWRVLRERPEELARACMLTPHSRAEYLDARAVDLGDVDEIEVARLVWVQITQGRSGTLRATGWRTYINPAGTRTSMPGYLTGYVDRMAPAAERLHRVSLECMPALEMIAKYGAHEQCCLYVDPPYLGSTRSDGGNGYHLDMRDAAEHAELLDALRACDASVVLSGYASDLYDTALSDWDRITIATTTSQGDSTARGRIEVLWSNRPITAQRALFGDRGRDE